MAVRSLLMKAVFFFKEESRVELMAKISIEHQCVVGHQAMWAGMAPLSPAQARALRLRNSPSVMHISQARLTKEDQAGRTTYAFFCDP